MTQFGSLVISSNFSRSLQIPQQMNSGCIHQISATWQLKTDQIVSGLTKTARALNKLKEKTKNKKEQSAFFLERFRIKSPVLAHILQKCVYNLYKIFPYLYFWICVSLVLFIFIFTYFELYQRNKSKQSKAQYTFWGGMCGWIAIPETLFLFLPLLL